jgi:hypothetical protein
MEVMIGSDWVVACEAAEGVVLVFLFLFLLCLGPRFARHCLCACPRVSSHASEQFALSGS